MANPEHFDVLYAINPYMKDESGELRKVNRALALQQWQALRAKYQELGFEVVTLPALAGYPDFVFSANQSFPYLSRSRPAVILSRMRSEFRQGEVEVFEDWYRSQGYEIQKLQGDFSFEGNGDALLHPGKPWIWGGHGPRTDQAVYREVSRLTGLEVLLLPLVRPEFYHLDTCFSILNSETVVIQPEAFPAEAVSLIRSRFARVIETSLEECAKFFTGNCHSPNGMDVILQRGCERFEARLHEAGFRVHPIDTSEFMKSGGSVFCMKMMCI
jgi:N-dimethylarginine dimethylaminohydrolase